MKLFPAVIALFFVFQGVSQDCNIAIKVGTKTTINIQSYTNPLLTDPIFIKAKTEQKDALIAGYNAKVLSGEIKPSSNYPMNFVTTKSSENGNGVEFKIAYKVANVDYYSYVGCYKDTIYSFRNKGAVPVGSPDNPLGISIQGPLLYPMQMKVGDTLPITEDVGFMFPSTSDIVVQKQVFSHMNTTTTRESGLAIETGTGNIINGPYERTKSRPVYKTIDVNVRKTLSFSSHAYQNMNAIITGEEEIIISGQKYKAFIIESESWSKGKMDFSFESNDEVVNRQQKAFAEKVQRKMEKIALKKQMTNSLGYLVLYSKVWFVPQLGGRVKTESYDIYGGISSIITTTGIE
ncbi:MAG: hypothetical protein IPK03_17085 [Bacteroidetes bacterium]|nr:hypothetical protein [Bacteroidota bacterium]